MILSDLIVPHAQSHPDDIAFFYKDQPLTYGQLNTKVLQCAQGLTDLGVKKGHTFGLLLRNCPEFVIFSLALGKIGAVTVPINFLEKPDRVALILNDANAMGVLTSKEFSATILAAAKTIKSLKHIFLREGSLAKTKLFDDLLKKGVLKKPVSVKDTDLMTLLYTSGTTGLPKGVMLSHKNFLANVDQCLGAIALKQSDKFLCLLPMFHSFSWTTCVLLPLKLRCVIVIIESLLPFDPILKSIWKYKITLFVAVPQIFSALATKIHGPKAILLRFLNPVRLAISGAAPLPPGVLSSFEKNVGVPLLEGYGLTEAAPVVSFNPQKKRKTGTVGVALPGVTMEIRDDEGKKTIEGEVGEIWVKGDNVMLGYYKKPKETAESLTKEGWLKTGDLGRLDEEGYLSIVDRKKDLIIVKGLNVYPQEIENVISKVPNVKEVAVIGKMNPIDGEELIRAFVVPLEGKEIDRNAVFAACKEQLAAYKRPKDIVILKELPKNALQKVLKKELRKL